MNEKLKECIKQKKTGATIERVLVECNSKEKCDSKMSFGNGYFCRLSPMWDKPEKVDNL